MKNINKKGISLIVLIITIIVVVILAAVVILTLSKNNPIESAKEAAFKEDIRAYQDELNMYITKEYQMLAGQRDSKITATGYEKDSTSEEYNNSVYKYLSSFKKKYENKIAIENDEIVYIGRDKKEREWTNNIVKMNPILTVKYVYENGEEAAPTYEETVTDGAYEVDSPIIDGYEPDHYTVSDKIDKDTEITVTYYPWSEGLAYEELGDGTYTVSGIGTFTGENLVIPRKYNGKDVTQINRGVFYRANNIKKIIISSSVNNILVDAFNSCSAEYITLNAKRCAGNSINNINNLKTLVIEKNVEIVNGFTFSNCRNLSNLEINSSVVDANSAVFAKCFSINAIKINRNNNKFRFEDGVLYSIDKKILYMYPLGKEGDIILSPIIEQIGGAAFYGNPLAEIFIDSNVKVVKGDAFNNCSKLEKLKINSEVIKSYSFISCSNLKYIEIGTKVKTIEGRAFFNCKNVQNVTYKGSKEEWDRINKGGWSYNTNITKVICTDGEIEL